MSILGRGGQRCALASIWTPARVLIPWASPLLSVLLCRSPRQHQGSSPSDVLHARGNPGCCKKLWALKELSCNAWAQRGGLCNHCSTSTFTTLLFPVKLDVFCDKIPLKKNWKCFRELRASASVCVKFLITLFFLLFNIFSLDQWIVSPKLIYV